MVERYVGDGTSGILRIFRPFVHGEPRNCHCLKEITFKIGDILPPGYAFHLQW
jgi:hypothetical protein